MVTCTRTFQQGACSFIKGKNYKIFKETPSSINSQLSVFDENKNFIQYHPNSIFADYMRDNFMTLSENRKLKLQKINGHI